jgi:serine/threonine protein kinase
MIDFLEAKYKKKCEGEDFFSHWSKSMDYKNWYICKLIGNGAFAKVYLVKHVTVDEVYGEVKVNYYAMKSISKSNIEDASFIQSTMKEKQLLLDMDHPLILKLHLAFQTPFSLYMIFDYINGGDMFFHIKKKGNFSEK